LNVVVSGVKISNLGSLESLFVSTAKNLYPSYFDDTFIVFVLITGYFE
jgi:hypothetical protein